MKKSTTNPLTHQEVSRQGGLATKKKHGKSHYKRMSALGLKVRLANSDKK